MTAMSTATGASLLAHGVHYAMVAAGPLGLAALLLPQALHRAAVAAPRDAHEARVLELRRRAAAGALTDPSSWRLRSVAFRQTDRTAALIVPMALVGSTTAAGAHAAVTPLQLPLRHGSRRSSRPSRSPSWTSVARCARPGSLCRVFFSCARRTPGFAQPRGSTG
ncbi:MAG TPA: hypothetical protein VFO49_06010 [Nocardioides sp.]|nr:hypothetical protein [Nocardioides sp.]